MVRHQSHDDQAADEAGWRLSGLDHFPGGGRADRVRVDGRKMVLQRGDDVGFDITGDDPFDGLVQRVAVRNDR